MKCPNEGCEFTSLRENMTAHAVSCLRRTTPCPNCMAHIIFENLDEHKAKWCEHAIISCPLICGKEFPRSHLSLHMHRCDHKAVTSQVSDCSKIVRRKDMPSHLRKCAISHIKMQSAEIQRLRRAIHDKTTKDYQPHEENVLSFVWKIDGFRQMQLVPRPLTSAEFKGIECRWRLLITEKNNLMLQLVSSSNPQTVQLRILNMARQVTNASEMILVHETTLEEKEMWGIDMKDVNDWMDDNGNLVIKCIMYTSQFR